MHFRRTVGFLFFAALLAAALAVGLRAQLPQIISIGQTTPPEVSGARLMDETPELWFVELNSPPAAEGASLATLDAEKAAFRRGAARRPQVPGAFRLRRPLQRPLAADRPITVGAAQPPRWRKSHLPGRTIATPPPPAPGAVADQTCSRHSP